MHDSRGAAETESSDKPGLNRQPQMQMRSSDLKATFCKYAHLNFLKEQDVSTRRKGLSMSGTCFVGVLIQSES